ncbi:MAG: hypothetical protein V1648_04240 [Candidatus Aenigmatarchaeota archaeon]
MNLAFHFLFNYIFLNALFGGAWQYLPVILVFSVIIDFDHLPYMLKTGRGVVKKRFGSACRTRFHEIYGLAIFSLVSCALYFFADARLVAFAMGCLVLHLSIDFITGKSVPFKPYSTKETFLDITPSGYWNKILFEITATAIMGVLFWLQIASLVL